LVQLISRHYRKSLGALIVYDLTKEQSFLNVQKWMEELKEHAEPEIVIMLVGNKLDTCERNPLERKVSHERAAEFAKQHNMLFMETSAFTDINVRDSFELLVQEIYNVRSREDLAQRRHQGKKIVHNDPSIEKGSTCCS